MNTIKPTTARIIRLLNARFGFIKMEIIVNTNIKINAITNNIIFQISIKSVLTGSARLVPFVPGTYPPTKNKIVRTIVIPINT
jgi:hypothetical protein